MPITREHVDTMHVDLPLGALFMAGVYFALASETAETPLFCSLCVATAGMAAAVKTTGLLYGAFLVATLAVSSGRAAATGRGRWRYGVLAAAGVAAGAFWYVRNAIELGNPLGYVRVGIGPFVLPGIIDPAWLRRTSVASVFDPTRGEHWRIMLGAIRHELGLPFLLVVLSAIGLLLAGRQRERRRLAIVTALIVLTGAVYCMTPFGGTIAPPPRAQLSAWTGQAFRYAFPLLGVLSAVSALGIATVPASERAVASVPVLLVIAGLMSAVLACAVALLAGAVALHRLLRRMDRRRRAAIGSLVLCLAVSLGTYWLRFRRDAERVRAYGGAGGFISAHLGPGDAVASVLSHRSYLFYGKDFRNDVVYLPASLTVDEWLAALRRARVSLVAVGPLRPEWRGRPEVAWLSAPDGQFMRVFGSDPTREPVVYRVPEVPNREPPRRLAP